MGERVYCRSRLSCDRATLTISDAAYGYGYKSLASASINAKVINAYGYKSIERSKIDSSNIKDNEMIINAFGYEAALRTTIMCRNGSICILNCKGNGCNDISFQCLTGAQCDISPSECITGLPDGGVTSEWISCPQYIPSESTVRDQLLINGFAARLQSDDGSDDDEFEIEYDDDERKLLGMDETISMEEQSDEDSVSKDVYHWVCFPSTFSQLMTRFCHIYNA